MVTEDQSEVVAFLGSPATHHGAPVDRIETHASIVFLAGTRAWKLKRAVRYDYLDFSTAERRRVLCEAEVRINRRTAPRIYRGVTAVTRESGGALAMGGQGPPVDWLVEMERFDQDGLFDRLAGRGALDAALMRPLAAAIAAFHRDAAVRRDHGGRSGMAWVIDGNAEGFAETGAGLLNPLASARVTNAARAELARQAGRLDERRESGRVRECHGDLHLRNIVLLGGRPTLFDAIEFNDEIACIDVLYDVAFLLMDLWRRRLPRHANEVLNGYVGATTETAGVALLPLFLSCRAAVRAKTTATAATLEPEARRREELRALAVEYLGMAEDLLRPPPPCLIAVGGFSGAGKSQLAMALAPEVGAVPGAVVLRSDEIRKQLRGVPALTRLGAEGYTTDMTRRVYAALAKRAGVVAGAGHAAIADAVFQRPDDRRAIEAAARAADVPFVGLWLDAPEQVLVDRAARRGADASDADARVVRAQVAHDAGPIDWHRLDASREAGAVLQSAIAVLDEVWERRKARGPRWTVSRVHAAGPRW